MMKKAFSLILTVCLAMVSLCAWAENDVTGTWYVIFMGMTGGTAEMKDGGVCTFSINLAGEEAEAEGTWSMEGDKVTVTVNDQSISFTSDGNSLMPTDGDFAALGMSGDLISFSREPGAITVAEFSAYMTDGTIPEGKTAEEMEAVQNEIMSLVGGMMEMAGSSEVTGMTEESAAELTVVDENFYVRDAYGSSEGYYIAKIRNNNENPVVMDSCLLILKNAEGTEIGRSEYFSDTGSRYLEPGEISVFSMSADVEEGAEVASWEASVKGSYSCWITDTSVPVSESVLVMEDEYNSHADVTVTNPTDKPLPNLYVSAAVLDESGKLYDLTSISLGQNMLASGSTIIFFLRLDSRSVEYCRNNQIQLSGLETYSWAEQQ